MALQGRTTFWKRGETPEVQALRCDVNGILSFLAEEIGMVSKEPDGPPTAIKFHSLQAQVGLLKGLVLVQTNEIQRLKKQVGELDFDDCEMEKTFDAKIEELRKLLISGSTKLSSPEADASSNGIEVFTKRRARAMRTQPAQADMAKRIERIAPAAPEMAKRIEEVGRLGEPRDGEE